MFDTMISKSLVQVIWIVWSGLIAIAGLIALFQSGSMLEALIVLIGTALGLGFARVLCEGMIVIFMIHENLAASREALETMQDRQRISMRSDGSVARESQPSMQSAPRFAAASTPSFDTSRSTTGSGTISTRPRNSGWADAYGPKDGGA